MLSDRSTQDHAPHHLFEPQSLLFPSAIRPFPPLPRRPQGRYGHSLLLQCSPRTLFEPLRGYARRQTPAKCHLLDPQICARGPRSPRHQPKTLHVHHRTLHLNPRCRLRPHLADRHGRPLEGWCDRTIRHHDFWHSDRWPHAAFSVTTRPLPG